MNRHLLKIKFKASQLIHQISWRKNKRLYKAIIWYLFITYIAVATFFFQRIYILPASEFEKILSLLISTIGITVAIIISFLFSKLYSEKSERIVRKQKIDVLSKKFTALRKIAHFIRWSSPFWNHFDKNIKSNLDHKYKKMTLYHYDRMGYDNHKKFHEEVKFGELAAQAYLGLREIEGRVRSDFDFRDRLLRKNYSLDELISAKDACQRMWKFMDEYHGDFREVATLPSLEKDPILENLKIIYPDFKTEDLNNNRIKKLFDDFADGLIREQYILTQRNSISFGKSFNALLFNLIMFVLLIIGGVLVFSINISIDLKLYITNIIVALFSATVIDLISNVIVSIRKELNVTDFYET